MLKKMVSILPLAILLLPPNTLLAASPRHYPATGGGTTEFNWQDEWGTIHLNSFADGLNDPGALVSTDGQVPCEAPGNNNLCNSNTYYTIAGTAKPKNKSQVRPLQNGIKFDLKHSIVNCMSWITPTTPFTNNGRAGGYDRGTCETYMSPPEVPIWRQIRSDYNLPETIVYSPIWDRRTNDSYDRNSPVGDPVGCAQQIVNNCIMDVNDCHPDSGNGKTNRGTVPVGTYVGYKYPVTHVFTPAEVEDLGGRGEALPSVYYKYEKILQLGDRVINSETPPSGYYLNYSEGTMQVRDQNNNYDLLTFSDVSGFSVGDTLTSGTYSGTINNINNMTGVVKVVRNGSSGSVLGNNDNVTNQNANSHTLDEVHLVPAGGNLISVTSYSYTPIVKHRHALSKTNNPANVVPAEFGFAIERVENKEDPNLSRIRTHKITNTDTDGTSFIIVDPKDFFDLNLYTRGGAYDSGYNKFDRNGLVETPDTCPILGMNGGYSGICDPSGVAGCNLPIYEVGPTTNVNDGNGNTYQSVSYPVRWSGYVKKWAFITPEQYLENIQDRTGSKGGLLYSRVINRNPVLMLTRSNDYCSPNERYSGQVPLNGNTSPDLPCIQYFQYQSIGGNSNGPMDGAPYDFVDLFQPDDDTAVRSTAFYSVMHLYNTDANGVKTPIEGTGSNIYLGGNGNGQRNKVSFHDEDKDYYERGEFKSKAVTKKNFRGVRAFDQSGKKQITGPIYNSNRFEVTGEYITADDPTVLDDPEKGYRLRLEPDTVVSTQFPGLFPNADRSVGPYCAVIKTTSRDNLFVPSNSKDELQSFLTAASRGLVPNVEARSCTGSYQTYAQVSNLATPNPNGTQTWIGQLRCSELTVKPSCNQTKRITALRYCLLENGNLGSCDNCNNAADPDSNIINGMLARGEIEMTQSKCYRSQVCFAESSVGCPPAATSGGHVFCLAPETKITMADGSLKEIKDIQTGEEVMAFNAKDSKKNKMKKAKVKATTITKEQEILDIDGLKITPKHKIVLSSGRGVKAHDIKIGDKILKEDGSILTVTKIDNKSPKIDVYNLILENDSDGYIANGIRVLSYPMIKEVEKSSKEASSK